MKNELLERLVESKEQLMRLKAVNCRMAHERVLIDSITQLPISGAVPEMEFERRDLCDADKRYKNPACSHTMARYPLENALDTLERFGEYGEWRDELNDLNSAIHLLDHAKGEAEKQSARVIKKMRQVELAEIENNSLDKELFSIKAEIAEMEQQHSIYAAKIERLKSKILLAVNSAIQAEIRINKD